MDTITTPAAVQSPPETSVIHNAHVSLTERSPASVVNLVQYDDTLPIVAVALRANNLPYTVPSGAAVNIRMKKPDGTYVYNPACGLSNDRQTVYIAVTVQMTVCSGRLAPVVEVVIDGGVAATGFFILDIDPNPIPEDAIASTDEYKTIQQLAAEVNQAAQIVTDNLPGIQYIQQNADTITAVAQNSENITAVGQSIDNVNAVGTNIADVQTAAQNIEAIQKAPTAAENAAASATLSESWAVGGTGTREGEDTNNAQYWCNQAQTIAKTALIDLVYPVGSIYISANNVSPQTFLGGTWQPVSQGRFLLGVDDSHAAGSTGGSFSHVQTAAEVGPHAHGMKGSTSTTANAIYGGYLISSAAAYDYWISGMQTVNESGAQAMDITNPYLAVYMWQRTA